MNNAKDIINLCKRNAKASKDWRYSYGLSEQAGEAIYDYLSSRKNYSEENGSGCNIFWGAHYVFTLYLIIHKDLEDEYQLVCEHEG